jgi:cell shape-determining protein MreC
LIIVLFAVSAVAFFLPQRWTGGLMSLIQILIPFQDATRVAVDAATDSLRPGPEPVPAEAFEAIQREKTALEHQLAAMSVRLADLSEQNSILTAIRTYEVNDQRIWTRGRLIPARVVAEDLLSWRDSRLINAGTLRSVQRGAPVMSDLFGIDQGSENGLRPGMAVLLSEALVGFVVDAGPHVARVRLISDVDTKMRVRIGRFTDDQFIPSPHVFYLTGQGDGAMEIRDVSRDDVDSGSVQVGDRVLADPAAGSAPAAMTIGTISDIRTDRHNPLLRILTVQSPVDALREVYVYDPGQDPEDG